MTDQVEMFRQIDVTVDTINQLIKGRMIIDQESAHIVPMLTAFASYVGMQMKAGIASGAIVSDGKGGIMPATLDKPAATAVD